MLSFFGWGNVVPGSVSGGWLFGVDLPGWEMSVNPAKHTDIRIFFWFMHAASLFYTSCSTEPRRHLVGTRWRRGSVLISLMLLHPHVLELDGHWTDQRREQLCLLRWRFFTDRRPTDISVPCDVWRDVRPHPRLTRTALRYNDLYHGRATNFSMDKKTPKLVWYL